MYVLLARKQEGREKAAAKGGRRDLNQFQQPWRCHLQGAGGLMGWKRLAHHCSLRRMNK